MVYALCYVLFTDESTFTRNCIFNTIYTTGMRISLMFYGTEDIRKRLSVNIWCKILGGHLLGPLVLHGRLTGASYLASKEHTTVILG